MSTSLWRTRRFARSSERVDVDPKTRLARLIAIAAILIVVLLALAFWRWRDSPITGADFGIQVKPTYPQAALRAAIHGQVVVAITVGSDGRLLASSIRSSSGSTLLDDAALDAVRESTYRPPVLLGVPMQRSYTVLYVFTLPRSSVAE